MTKIHEYTVTATVGLTQDCDVKYLGIEHGPPPVLAPPKGAGYYVMFYVAAYMLSAILRDTKQTGKTAIDGLMADVRKSAEKLATSPTEVRGDDPLEAGRN